MIIIINFAIVGSLSLLLGVNAFKIWDKFTEDKSLDDLRDDILGIIYYSLTIITEISLIILLNFLVYLLLSGDLKSTMSLTGFIFLIDIFLFLLMSLFFRLQENKRRQINIRNPSYVIAE
jgi:predicted membrane channel-forming protein YqfA (hemolysin III family)